MNPEQLQQILTAHKLWVTSGGKSGVRADLREIHLKGANLKGANLKGANLRGAHLQGAHLQEANLQGADLQGAHLQGADLQGANLQGANLWRSRLWAAINNHVVNCGGHPGLKPHELVHGEEWGREHIEVIEGFIRDLSSQRKSAKAWKQKYNELMRMQETYIKRLHALEAGEEKK